jgi:hypothetical protein
MKKPFPGGTAVTAAACDVSPRAPVEPDADSRKPFFDEALDRSCEILAAGPHFRARAGRAEPRCLALVISRNVEQGGDRGPVGRPAGEAAALGGESVEVAGGVAHPNPSPVDFVSLARAST